MRSQIIGPPLVALSSVPLFLSPRPPALGRTDAEEEEKAEKRQREEEADQLQAAFPSLFGGVTGKVSATAGGDILFVGCSHAMLGAEKAVDDGPPEPGPGTAARAAPAATGRCDAVQLSAAREASAGGAESAGVGAGGCGSGAVLTASGTSADGANGEGGRTGLAPGADGGVGGKVPASSSWGDEDGDAGAPAVALPKLFSGVAIGKGHSAGVAPATANAWGTGRLGEALGVGSAVDERRGGGGLPSGVGESDTSDARAAAAPPASRVVANRLITGSLSLSRADSRAAREVAREKQTLLEETRRRREEQNKQRRPW